MSILYIHCGISILNCLEEKNAYSFQYAKQYECILIFYLHNLIEITSNHFFLISNAKYVYAYNHAWIQFNFHISSVKLCILFFTIIQNSISSCAITFGSNYLTFLHDGWTSNSHFFKTTIHISISWNTSNIYVELILICKNVIYEIFTNTFLMASIIVDSSCKYYI